MSARTPNEIDQHVGARIRIRRSVLGMAQSELGDKLGVTFQQIQKYERGANRVGASRLFALSKVLGVSLDYFFEGLDASQSNDSSESDAVYDFIASPDGILLARLFQGVNDQPIRRSIIDLLRSLQPETAGQQDWRAAA